MRQAMNKKNISFHVVLLFWGIAFFAVSFLHAQNSLWRDQNPYSDYARQGSVVQILVNEKVSISNDDSSKVTAEFKLKKNPDKNYLEFLKPIDHNESSARKYKDKVKYIESMEFSITGIIGNTNNDGVTRNITARKNITIDGKPFRVQIQGVVDPIAIRNRKIKSSDIANFVMTVQSERPQRTDNSINLKQPVPQPQQTPQAGQAPNNQNLQNNNAQTADANVANAPAVPEARLDAQETERIKLDYLRKAVGALQ